MDDTEGFRHASSLPKPTRTAPNLTLRNLPLSGTAEKDAIGNHSFRAIGITDYLERGGDTNVAKRMAGHSNVKTTELYDRRDDEVSFSEIERVGI
jgi:integrase